MPPTQRSIGSVGTMLALFFALGRFLGEFSALAAFDVTSGWFFSVLGRSGVDFGGSRAGPGRVLEPQNVDLPMLLRVHALGLRACSDPCKTLAGAIEIKARAFARSSKIDQKLRFKRYAHAFATKTAMRIQYLRLGTSPGSISEGFGSLPRLSWSPPGHSWTASGASGVPLGLSLGALWHLLAAKWCLRHARARFLIDFGLISPPFCVSSEGMFCMLSSAPRTSLHNVFMDAVTTLLHLLALFLLPFWCGGLCTAHGIDDAD